MIKGQIQEENIIIVNIYTQFKSPFNIHKQLIFENPLCQPLNCTGYLCYLTESLEQIFQVIIIAPIFYWKKLNLRETDGPA